MSVQKFCFLVVIAVAGSCAATGEAVFRAAGLLACAAFGEPMLSDITMPGDPVIGVPNDGNWPGGEAPELAIDGLVGTKYLHFGGQTQPTGFRVTPSHNERVVAGLTFTTANDAPARDPIAFELSGSNVSINGP